MSFRRALSPVGRTSLPAPRHTPYLYPMPSTSHPATAQFALTRRRTSIRRWRSLIRVLMYLLIVISIAMVIRRALTIEGVIPSVSPGGGPPFDKGFGLHPLMTFIHILPGALFMLTGPLQFLPRFQTANPRLYRISTPVFITTGYIVGISAILMNFIIHPIGGINEAAASLFFATWFLIALTRAATLTVRTPAFPEERPYTSVPSLANRQLSPAFREWMIRAFAIGLAIGTVRPIMGLFFAFSGLPPQVFFGTAFWIGFTLHLILAEVWINYTRYIYI